MLLRSNINLKLKFSYIICYFSSQAMAAIAASLEMVEHLMESIGVAKLTTIAIQVQIATSQLNILFLTFGNAIVGNRFVVIFVILLISSF